MEQTGDLVQDVPEDVQAEVDAAVARVDVKVAADPELLNCDLVEEVDYDNEDD